ncbi:hypothetical protein L1281_000207 [Neisseria sp. HSC-16F19]|nr:hypothetical protein [Neisseria sp. HSC-16F19]MCP2039642.1 hypothetical protein [Neisseria sp. HSC-16F19]
MLNERQWAWISLLLLAVLPLLPLAAWLHPQGQGGWDSEWAFRLPVFSLPMVLAAAVYIVGRPAAVCGAAVATAAVYLLFDYWIDGSFRGLLWIAFWLGLGLVLLVGLLLVSWKRAAYSCSPAAAFAAACATQAVLLLLPLLLAALLL